MSELLSISETRELARKTLIQALEVYYNKHKASFLLEYVIDLVKLHLNEKEVNSIIASYKIKHIDLTEVKGLGPATAVKLYGVGIKSAIELAQADLFEIQRKVNITHVILNKIINNAQSLVRSYKLEINDYYGKFAEGLN